MPQAHHCHECGSLLYEVEREFTVGELVLDTIDRRATWRGEEVHLPPTPFQIVQLLARRRGRTVRKDSFFMLDILPEDADEKALQIHIWRIRKLFKEVDPSFAALELDWGEGYRWAA